MSTRKGRFYEEQAAKYLESQKWSIIERNVHTPFGEVDLVALRNKCLCFVEVKGRRYSSDWSLDAITSSKKRKILLSIEYYIQNVAVDIEYKEMFIGVILIEGDSLRFLYNAFDGD